MVWPGVCGSGHGMGVEGGESCGKGTKDLPRDQTRTKWTKEEVWRWKTLEYIPTEVVEILDKARSHLGEGGPELASENIARMLGG